MRMKMNELPDYIQTLQDLREIYANHIDIKIGLEVEYVPDFTAYYEDLLGTYRLDLLLLGQHFTRLSDGRYSFELKDKSDEAKLLAEGMIQGMESGLFFAVAHPDQIFRRYKQWDDSTTDIANEIIACAKNTNSILEINIDNMLAYPKHARYWPEFWALCPPDVKNIYGLDAHSVDELERYYLARRKLIDKRGENLC